MVGVDPLLRELIGYLARPDVVGPPRARAEHVILDILRPVTVSTLHLPMPVDVRARAIAEALSTDPADDRSLAEWGRRVGATSRTLLRIFRSETGMTFARWRTQVRIRAAIPLLADRAPVGVVARHVGYQTVSSFITAFRDTTGYTPGAYFSPTIDPSASSSSSSADLLERPLRR